MTPPRRSRPLRTIARLLSAALALTLLLVLASAGPPAEAQPPPEKKCMLKGRPVTCPTPPKSNPAPPKSDPAPEKKCMLKGRPVTCPPPKPKTPPRAKEDGPCGGISIGCLVEKSVFKLFGGDRGWITAPYLRWLIRVPNLAGSDGAIADLSKVTQAAGWALLLGLVTFSILHYYALGLTSQGNSAFIADAITRSVGAALMILAWPWLFENGVALTDTLSDALIPGAQLEAFLVEMVAGVGITAFFSGKVALAVGIIIALAFVLLSIALYLTKLGLTVGLMIAYVAFPLAAALWAVPSMSSPMSYAARFCAAAASTQVMWALCIALVGALNKDTFLWNGGGPWTDKLTKPLFIGAMLAAMLAIPRHTFSAWGLGMGGGSSLSGAASHLASSAAADAAKSLGSKESRKKVLDWGARRLPGRWPQHGGTKAAAAAQLASGAVGAGASTPGAKAPCWGKRRDSSSGQRPDKAKPDDRTRGGTPDGRRTGGGQPPPPSQRDLPAGDPGAARSVYDRIRGARTTDVGAFQASLENLSAAGYGDAARGVLGGDTPYEAEGMRDRAVMGQFALSATGEPDLAPDFRVLGSSTPATRQAGLAGWVAPTESAPAPPPTPTTPVPQPPPTPTTPVPQPPPASGTGY